MFDKDFYPTPPEVVEYMLQGNDFTGKTILEPSAGSGNMLEVATKLGAKTIACELNEDLSEIAKSKADRFLKRDFLQVTKEEVSHIDFILMNPPFSADEKHIEHAWEIAPAGCEIAALCNMETFSNRYTRARAILGKIIENHGFIESMGSVFERSERKTDVEIGLIRLYKPGTNEDFEDFFDYEPDEAEKHENGIMPYDAVREVVQRYVNACKLYDTVADTAIQMNSLIGEFGVGNIVFTLSSEKKEESLSNFKVELRKKCWIWIFNKMNMGKYMTSNLREELNKFTEKQQNVPFTMRNIYKMFEMVIGTHDQRMRRACVEVFDKLTSHHKENRYNLEGWKTNEHYLVGKKFILPYIFEIGWSGHLDSKVMYNRNGDLFEDLIKALDYLTGNDLFKTLTTRPDDPEYTYYSLGQFCKRVEMQPNKWYDCTYFEIKGFKKGTMHAKWKEEKVWARFNQIVAEEKGFELPENI